MCCLHIVLLELRFSEPMLLWLLLWLCIRKSFVSDPVYSCLPSASIILCQTNLLAGNQRKISVPSQFLTVHSSLFSYWLSIHHYSLIWKPIHQLMDNWVLSSLGQLQGKRKLLWTFMSKYLYSLYYDITLVNTTLRCWVAGNTVPGWGCRLGCMVSQYCGLCLRLSRVTVQVPWLCGTSDDALQLSRATALVPCRSSTVGLSLQLARLPRWQD